MKKIFGALAVVGTLGGCAETAGFGAAAIAKGEGASDIGAIAVGLGAYAAVKHLEDLKAQGKCTVHGQPSNDGAIWLKDNARAPRIVTYLRCNTEDLGRGNLDAVLNNPRYSSVNFSASVSQQQTRGKFRVPNGFR